MRPPRQPSGKSCGSELLDRSASADGHPIAPENPSSFLRFADAYRELAEHLFHPETRARIEGNLIDYLDREFPLTPQQFRAEVERTRVDLAIAHASHQKLTNKLKATPTEPTINAPKRLEAEIAELQAQIELLFPQSKSDAEIEDYERQFQNGERAKEVFRRLIAAMKAQRLQCFLSSEFSLTSAQLMDPLKGTFSSRESAGEFEIDGRMVRGVVGFRHADFDAWKKTEPSVDGELTTPAQREGRAVERLRQLLRNEETKYLARDKLYDLLRAEIPKLTKSGEYKRARDLVSKEPEFSHIKKSGRRRKSPNRKG